MMSKIRREHWKQKAYKINTEELDVEVFGDWLDIEDKEDKLINIVIIPWEFEYKKESPFLRKRCWVYFGQLKLRPIKI